MDQKIKTGLIVGLLLVGGYLTATKQLVVNQNPVVEETPQPNPVTPTRKLSIGKTTLDMEVRKTEAEQELGLSYRTGLTANQGMAFVYPQPQRVMFWMKGMNFPLDFIFAARGIVVEITEGVAAPTKEQPEPKTVVPVQAVDTVIEVKAGVVASQQIRVGDKLVWE